MAAGEEHPWIDVSVPIYEGMVHWPGDPPVRLPKEKELEGGDGSTLTRLDMSAHTGTHVDAPVHFIEGGAGVDEIDVSALIGPARVAYLPDVEVVSAQAIEALKLAPKERLLLKTRNSRRCWESDDFVSDFTHLSVDAARVLCEAQVRTVGIDYLSIGGGDDNPEVHRTLLGAGICVIEGLNLSAVDPGEYDLICLPLRLRGGDGAPARVMVRRR